jgi:hypothetical protein
MEASMAMRSRRGSQFPVRVKSLAAPSAVLAAATSLVALDVIHCSLITLDGTATHSTLNPLAWQVDVPLLFCQ